MSSNNKLLIICGPTATGKTALSVSLAKIMGTEIISADSMNVYRELNVGTAKPDKTEMNGIKHHLIDVVSPFDKFSVGDYENLALPIVNRLFSEGKTPIICGGTGFYINSLIYNLSYGNSSANLIARVKYFQIAEKDGNEAVFEILKSVDAETASKLHANDIKRVIRALEIYESTGKPMSKIKDSFEKRFDYKAYAIDFPRSVLYDRINKRVDKMLENGLVDEVKKLIDDGITIENQSMQGIGYKEVYDYIKGNSIYDNMVESIKLNTRHYAKRQITFFKRYENLKMLCNDDSENLAKTILEDFNK